MTEVTKLTRKDSIKNNVDPFGTKWGISLLDGSALYIIGEAPDSFDVPVTIPKSYPHISGGSSGLEGKFTKPEYAQKAIENYLNKIWDLSEAAEKKKERKEYAEKVA